MELTLQEPERQPEKAERKLKLLGRWLAGRYKLRSSRDTYVWRFASGGLMLLGSASMLTAALGMPTGLGALPDAVLFIGANLAAMGLSGYAASIVLSLVYVPVPRRFAAFMLYVGIETYLILYYAELGVFMSILLAAAYTLAGSAAGCLLALLLRSRMRPLGKAATALLAAGAAALVIAFGWPEPAGMPKRDPVPAEAAAEPLKLPNPSEPGTYAFASFTYGSGRDKHRSWFGEDVDVATASADASAYITKWPALKTYFWGFDQHALPINGRVWAPEGAGKHPIALIVHGNHLMEHFSDGGYAYLGELLASHGIIAVSVDENFLNYSVWSGIPNHDMKMRAWVLLKHLQQLQRLNEGTDNPLAGRIDFGSVALIGHSRGGQAVAMAADADRWFKEDRSLDGLEAVKIKSVVAIAPTDKRVDERSARLAGVNYLTLQGARDADVNNFYGDRQYGRTSFSMSAGLFKAALYIADANHSQFNTAWGKMDERLPGGLFLNRDGMLKGDEQREIAEVYVSAFLQATLLDKPGYRTLFRDYRTASRWLPDTGYTSRYEEAGFTEIARYDSSSGKTKLVNGGKAEAEGMSEWKIASAEDRDGNNKGTKGLELEWEKPGAEYELRLPAGAAERAGAMGDPNLVFSMANLERDLLAEAEAEAEGGMETAVALPPLPKVEVELSLADGRSKRLGLSEVLQPPAPAYTAFMSLPWLEKRMKNKKYKQPTEPVFQTFVVPIEDFGISASSADEISGITFRFESGQGKVMLDDIGFMP
ncbi:alpha/beta hydrolase family protein [Paenibacillus arenilitoris]|uniref:Alpha/beta hydrolase n=1 Tax=Paenibacillus arenilitoris TaxID=2772299 RepID=A0A927H7E4_9BACL|nr:alpha/beta hydrolase [Paenibacillus arenilitoris]MBD2869509.1 alpha/beta hydrolase [Paenibacillus arenilitoris]